MLTRHSSRRRPLDTGFLAARLAGARSYDRIAGYFSSSILEVAGEALESVEGKVRVVCNSQLSRADVEVAKAAQTAMRREWCDARPEDLGDGARTAFLGSANESAAAFHLNYELVWEDDSPEAAAWVQEEFDALWSSPFAVPLADFVVRDLDRLSRRETIGDVDGWRDAPDPDPASVVVEAPVYRKEVGLWEHQKHFVKLAFDAHRGPHGARFVLADQVGLGKTLQLAMAAQLMALYGDGPVLILAPKPLLRQWQDELDTLLGLPTAVWDRGRWVDEHGIEHPGPGAGAESIRRCPRRVGIVSTGLVTGNPEAAARLAEMRFECVILDEAHRARRRNLSSGSRAFASARPNHLLKFLREVSPRTRSLLLATATPVQLHPVEACDLLDALAQGSHAVLGAPGSRWRNAKASIDLLLGAAPPPTDFHERWEWLRNPFPPRSEGRDFEILRRSLSLPDEAAYAPGRAVDALRPPDRQRVESGFDRFVERHNPYIRAIVLRTREQLENTIDPETGEPLLTPVAVRLHGESDEDAIVLPPFLEDAYAQAEAFCRLLAERANTGFFRTMLLRRMGSTMEAGRLTVTRILDGWGAGSGADSGTDDGVGAATGSGVGYHYEHREDEYDDDEDEEETADDRLRALTSEERRVLSGLAQAMEANRDRDPKCDAVRRLLVDEGWLERGCIVFSQYYDSVWWLAGQLARELPEEAIGVYAGAGRSGVMRRGGAFEPRPRDTLKDGVRRGELRLLLGTDAASEGLNLQRLGTLINLDLPWNPSRLEQRKGRIQRIGQVRPEVDVYNMRYANSVEDRVRGLLSARLENVSRLFGQLPDTLEDVWVRVALGEIEQAKQTIGAVPDEHPFALRHYREVRPVDWESCARVLADDAKRRSLARGWSER